MPEPDPESKSAGKEKTATMLLAVSGQEASDREPGQCSTSVARLFP
jgi:hypothetical protein